MRRILLSFLVLFLSLPATAAITGVVIDLDGQPLSGARVSIFAPESIEARRARLLSKESQREPLASVSTNSKGTFTLESPKGHSAVQLQIAASGFAPEMVRLLADDDAGAIALTSAPMRRGTITAAGKPVFGATVIWTGIGSDFMAHTDEAGHYSVPDPSKWANQVMVVHPDFAIVQESGLRNDQKLDQALEKGVTLTGRVVGEDGKTPVANADLLVDGIRLGTTGEDGTFEIAGVPSQWEEIEARQGKRGGFRARAGKAAVTIRIAPLAVVTGSVVDAKTRMPLAEAEVLVGPESPFGGRRRGRGFFSGSPMQSLASAVTDAKGRFSVTVLPGRYTLVGEYPASSVANTAVSLSAGQSVNKTLWATARGRISGTVVDESRRPISGAHISTHDAGRVVSLFTIAPLRGPRNLVAFSAPDGHFALRNVEPDADVQVEAVKKGYPAGESATVRVGSGERRSGVVVTIPHGIALTGKVTDRDGKPLSGVSVRPVEARGERGFVMRRMIMRLSDAGDEDVVQTASDGSFTVRLAEGTYNVIFKREGFAVKTVQGATVNATTEPLLVRLEPGVEITGRVVRDGAGVEGVTVDVFSDESNANATTGPDGSFTLADLTPGSMMLSARKPDDFIQQARPVTAPARDVVIELPEGGRITGRVVDKDSKAPVASFQAGISGERSGGGMVIMMPPMLKAFTNDDGTFTLDHVPPGPTQLVVSAPGYTMQRIPGLNVENGKTLSNLEVAMEIGAKLSGRVTGPDGAPLGGVAVRAAQGSSRVINAGGGPGNSMTDPNGEYTIDSIEPGEKTFTFTKQGYVSETRSVTVSGSDSHLDVQLSSGMSLSGVVVTEAGIPVADASVSAWSAADANFRRGARTDANGSFQLSGLAPGHYTISASKEGLAQGRLDDFDVSSGAPARVVMKSGGTIVGHVSGLTDAELRQTSVTASSGTGGASAEVDGSGNFRIEGAPTGSVRVAARTSATFIGGGKTSAPKSVQVDPGSTAQVDIDFTSTTVIRGRVTQSGQPLAGVVVAFFPDGGAQTSASGSTDSNGMYELSGLQDGPYNVAVRDVTRAVGFTYKYNVSGSSTFDIDIKSATLRGRVVDASTGEPVPDAQVAIEQVSSSGMTAGSRIAQTDPSGAFVVQNLQTGSYRATALKDGFGHDSRPFTVGDTAPEDLEFKIAPSAGVTLQVVDARDNRILAANVVRVVDAQGQETPSGGGFRFNSTPAPIKLTLAPGRYTVTVEASGYAPATVAIMSPSTQTVALSPGASLVLRSRGGAPRSVRLVGSDGSIYPRGRNGVFMLDAAPAVVTLNNVAPGNYTLQLLDPAGNVAGTVPVTVAAGQNNAIDV